MDEGAFVIDYLMPPGTALSETDRFLKHVEKLLLETPEVDSYSRRTGAQLALAVAEPHTGDFLIKLKARSKTQRRGSQRRLARADPCRRAGPRCRYAGYSGRLDRRPHLVARADRNQDFSTDVAILKKQAAQIAEVIDSQEGTGRARRGGREQRPYLHRIGAGLPTSLARPAPLWNQERRRGPDAEHRLVGRNTFLGFDRATGKLTFGLVDPKVCSKIGGHRRVAHSLRIGRIRHPAKRGG